MFIGEATAASTATATAATSYIQCIRFGIDSFMKYVNKHYKLCVLSANEWATVDTATVTTIASAVTAL